MNSSELLLRFKDLSELDWVAQQLLEKGRDTSVWLFHGPMGVGKTTLIKKLCEKLEVTSAVQSPTFAIVNEYETAAGEVLYHFDFYRIKSETEAYDIGVEEYLFSGDYCFIEWPDKIESLWPENYFSITIGQDDAGARILGASLVNPTTTSSNA